MNDNSPKFSNSSYIVHVREDVVNQVLTTLSATDLDSGKSLQSKRFTLLVGYMLCLKK